MKLRKLADNGCFAVLVCKFHFLGGPRFKKEGSHKCWTGQEGEQFKKKKSLSRVTYKEEAMQN